MYTIDVIREIGCANPSIDHFRLVQFKIPQDIIKDHSWSCREETTFEKALNLRALSHIPFWECLMLTQMESDSFSAKILKKTNFHNEISIYRLIRTKDIDQTLTAIPYIGINSRVQCSPNKISHLPMLDFRLPCNVNNTSVATEICHQLGYNGYLLNSGRSYHFIGDKPISQQLLYAFLGRALLYSPIVDTTWIAHQLIDGTTTLRIGKKYDKEPELLVRIK